jgi:hypothetical protein
MDFTDIELTALRDVWFTRHRRPGVSAEFHIHRIFREYSQKFFTPLHQVYDLPVEFVVTRWMEEIYEDYKDEDLIKEAKALTKSQDTLLAERRREDEKDVDMWLFERDIARSEKAAKNLEELVKETMTAFDRFRPMTHEEKIVGSRMSQPVEMTNTKIVPGEKISIKFEEVDLDSDSFGLLDDPKAK